MSTSKRILIVEDEMMIALHIEDTLAQLGHEVITATTSEQAEHLLANGRIDLAIVDYRLTNGNTEVLMDRLQGAGVPFIVCSGMPEQAERRLPSPSTCILEKPFTSEALIEAVSALVVRPAGNELH